jgi:hypothetical protein
MPTNTTIKDFIIDSGAAISVAPPGFCPEIAVDPVHKNECKLQSASGQRLQVYGQKIVPIKFGESNIEIIFVICEVTQPLISALDLNNKGVAILLNPKNPKLIIKGGSFPSFKDLHLFRMKLDYQSEEKSPFNNNVTIPNSYDNSIQSIYPDPMPEMECQKGLISAVSKKKMIKTFLTKSKLGLKIKLINKIKKVSIPQ